MSKEEREKVKVDDQTIVKVKDESSTKGKGRPTYSCSECNVSFPSALDLEAHQKIDHIKKGTRAEA